MERPIVDIYVPTYEPDPVLLRETLDSLLAQTEERWTCTVYDDASTVDVAELIRPYLSDPRFSFTRHSVRRGIGGNWNACLGKAQRAKPDAPFVQYLFQDDVWRPNYLRTAIAVLEREPTVGFVSAEHAYACDESMETARDYHRLQAIRAKLLTPGKHPRETFLPWWLSRGLTPNVIGEPSFVMIRRALIREVGPFSEEFQQILDVEYWVRLLLRSDWYFSPENLGEFRVHRKAASYLHFRDGKAIVEHFRLLEHLRKILPRDGSVRQSLDQSLDQHFANIIGHAVNRFLQGRRVGRGGVPVLRYLCVHPHHAARGLVRYVPQALGRWSRKGKAALFRSREGE